MAIVVGTVMVVGGIVVTVIISKGDGEFKPAGLVVFSLPGLLWAAAGGLLAGLGRKFTAPFGVFLVLNNLLGAFFAIQARSLGRTSGDTQIFAAVGLGFIGGSILFGLIYGLMVRDIRRADKSK